MGFNSAFKGLIPSIRAICFDCTQNKNACSLSFKYITCLIPEDGQYSRNIQHELTDLIKVVVVDCNIYVNLYCTSQRDEFYENYTVSLLDEPRSVERWYNDSNEEKSNYSGKEPFPMPLQPPQILNRMTRD